jgi:hypothetical protein
MLINRLNNILLFYPAILLSFYLPKTRNTHETYEQEEYT